MLLRLLKSQKTLGWIEALISVVIYVQFLLEFYWIPWMVNGSAFENTHKNCSTRDKINGKHSVAKKSFKKSTEHFNIFLKCKHVRHWQKLLSLIQKQYTKYISQSLLKRKHEHWHLLLKYYFKKSWDTL